MDNVTDQAPIAKLGDLVLTEFVNSGSEIAELLVVTEFVAGRAPAAELAMVSPDGGALRFRRGDEWSVIMVFPAAVYAALLARMRRVAGEALKPGIQSTARIVVNGVHHHLRFGTRAPKGDGLVITRADTVHPTVGT